MTFFGISLSEFRCLYIIERTIWRCYLKLFLFVMVVSRVKTAADARAPVEVRDLSRVKLSEAEFKKLTRAAISQAKRIAALSAKIPMATLRHQPNR
jgi:hypothetical protein